ncbi:MAG: carboxylating nicotinate-nucleotide diphosphorylase [Bacteroidetes bacterium]|nr:carboxylating nicotinate-nucleotide diphosphorylase [Bacteroidota bacterium]
MDLEEIIRLALQEDIGDGDHTSLSTIPAGTTGRVSLLVKEEGVLAGVKVARKVFQILDPGISMKVLLTDGSLINKGDIAFTAEGSVVSLLGAERLVLNFMQRMSGIATKTRQYVDALKGLHTRVLDTRKTTPNLRLLEKEAVRIGGGGNHRFGLFDMILIKDNHVDFAGGIGPAIRNVKKYLENNGKLLAIEIETRNLEEVTEVMKEGGVNRIMLDNFSPELIREAVKHIGGKYETEASGGITLSNIRQYGECGVDFISVGALTHQISSLDLSLKAIQ